jgi:hypothetical protein
MFLSYQIVHVVSMDDVPSKLASTSFQSKEVSGAQKSEFLLLFNKHSSLVSGSPALQTRK